MSVLLRLARLIEATTGNTISERDLPRLRRLVADRMRLGRFSDLESYVQQLRMDPNDGEWRELLAAVTIKESYLFRGRQQFRAIAETAIPELVQQVNGGARIRVWSAGCARGEEPATLAVVLAESEELTGHGWEILATDVDEVALEAAARWRFPKRAVSHVPDELLDAHFQKAGADWVLNGELSRQISIRKLNLITAELPFPSQHFDLVLLRNVLIYFSLDVQARVLAEVSRTLKPHGFLFLGSTESLLQHDLDLVPRDHEDCFSYGHRNSYPDPRHLDVSPKRSSTGVQPSAPSVETRTPAGPPGRSRTSGHDAATPPQVQRFPIPMDEIEQAILNDDLIGALTMTVGAQSARPGDPTLRAAEGRILHMLSRLEEAIRAYRAALYLEPELFQIRYLMARCLEELGAHRRGQSESREATSSARKGSRQILDLPACFELPDRDAVLAG